MSHSAHAQPDIAMSATTLPERPEGSTELGVVYASVDGVNEHSFDECFRILKAKAKEMGATQLTGMQLVQSQFQWNQRTSLLATAFKKSG